MKKIHLSDEVSLDAETAQTGVFAMLGIRGSGKTNTGLVLAEQLWDAKRRFVVIDPLGVWWGIRLKKDGKTPSGRKVVIFGGDHQDLPLDEGSAEKIADVVVDDGVSAILDLSSLSKSAQDRFVTKFARRLFQRNREAIHVFIDEADAFAPQSRGVSPPEVLGAIEDLVRRGRSHGIGLSLITQRPAVLNKNVLTQAGTLVLHRVTSPQDRDAFTDWAKATADPARVAEIAASLATFRTGDAWVWSPSDFDLLQKTRIHLADGYESSRTPKAGESRTIPKTLDELDVSTLKTQLADAVARYEDTDAKALKRRLQDALAENAKLKAAKPKPVYVDKPVHSETEIKRLEKAVARLDAADKRTADAMERTTNALEKAVHERAALRTAIESMIRGAVEGLKSAVVQTERAFDLVPRRPARATSTIVDGAAGSLKRGARAMLAVLAAFHPRELPRARVALNTGIGANGSTFKDYLSSLRTAGLVEDVPGGALRLTDAGVAAAGPVDRVSGPAEIVALWSGRLKAGARAILEILMRRAPAYVTREELGKQTEIESGGSTMKDYLSSLRTAGLLEDSSAGGDVRAHPDLFGA